MIVLISQPVFQMGYPDEISCGKPKTKYIFNYSVKSLTFTQLIRVYFWPCTIHTCEK